MLYDSNMTSTGITCKFFIGSLKKENKFLYIEGTIKTASVF